MPSERFVIELKKFLDTPERREWKGLDVGCGPHIGILAEYGLDAAPISTFVNPDYPREKFTQGNVYKMPFEDNSFDYVVSAHLIEHLKRRTKALKEMVRVARHVVIANVPRYTRDKKVAEDPCVRLDFYYFSAFPEKMEKYGLTREDFDIWSPGATTFDGFDAHHCAWFPHPKNMIKLFNKAGCFTKVRSEVCPGNCGETNTFGWL